MNLRILPVFLALVALSQCDFLTRQENENRLRTCGYKKPQHKVLNGVRVNQSVAPWALELTECTGTLISSRHAITATHCFSRLTHNGWDIVVKNRNRGGCANGHFFITDPVFLSRFQVKSDKKVVAKMKMVTLLNACLEKRIPAGLGASQVFEDVAVIDFEKDVQMSETLWPACVAAPGPPVPVGLDLHYFGFGHDPINLPNVFGILRYEHTRTVPPTLPVESHYFFANDPRHFTIACPGDSGGGAVDDKATIIGVLSQTTCDHFVETHAIDSEIYSSVAYYANYLCNIWGICEGGRYPV